MHFPQHEIAQAVQDVDEQAQSDVDDMTNNSASSVASAKTVATRNSADATVEESKSDDDSLSSLFEVGTGFWTAEHDTVWKIRTVSPNTVIAEVVNAGRILTLEPGDTRLFQRTNQNLRNSLISFNQ